MKTILKALIDYKKLNRSSFHTPGHKDNLKLYRSLKALDLTELPLTDDLYFAHDFILNSEKKLSEMYGCERSIISCGGNTLCIQTMLKLCCTKSKNLICDRNIHKSAVSTMALLDINPFWISRKIDVATDLLGDIDVNELENLIKKVPNLAGVYITSPDYYGRILNILEISVVCKKYGVPLLVDNAHGSHLKFSNPSLHPLDFGADMVCDSLHKTLPVLTGGAVLHINNKQFISNAKLDMSIFGSTSPSYLIMASIDWCRLWINNKGTWEFNLLKNQILEIKDCLTKKGIKFLSEKIDPYRITINHSSIGYSGKEFLSFLYKHKVEPEFFDDNYTVFIPTVFNRIKDWDRLKHIIKKIKIEPKNNNKVAAILDKFPEKCLSIREAVLTESITIPVEQARGQIVSNIVCPCPPGVPIIMPGEIVRDVDISCLLNYGVKEISIIKK